MQPSETDRGSETHPSVKYFQLPPLQQRTKDANQKEDPDMGKGTKTTSTGPQREVLSRSTFRNYLARHETRLQNPRQYLLYAM